MPEPPSFDGCEVVRKVRSEPMFDDYLARQEPLGRPVLIRALASSILPSSPLALSLEREARILATLRHPNIVEIYDYVRRGERLWLVLEWVDGLSVAEILEHTGRFSQAAAVALALELTRAFEHMHREGVVHRNPRAEHVWLSKAGETKLSQFASAVALRAPQTKDTFETVSGASKPNYWPPERILGEPASSQEDQFSLGVLLYELLCGTRPFDGADDSATIAHIRHEAPEPLVRRVPRVLPTLDRIVRRCLEKSPSDRYSNTAELRSALEHAAKLLEIEAPKLTLRAFLEDAGLVTRAPATSAEPRLLRGALPTPLRRVVWGLAFAGILLASGGLAIQATVARRAEAHFSETRAGEGARESRSFLRVVARPWAHVVVDGQRLETTPFSRPIALSAGTHYVRLDHPNAPSERRTIHLAVGETLFLDVSMQVPTAEPSAQNRALLPSDAGWDDGSP